MSAPSKLDTLIATSFSVPNHIYPVTYDETRTISYGYWICRYCKDKFFEDAYGYPTHYSPPCSLKDRAHPYQGIIYVFGPEEGFRSPFTKEEIEQIKKTALVRESARAKGKL